MVLHDAPVEEHGDFYSRGAMALTVEDLGPFQMILSKVSIRGGRGWGLARGGNCP